MSAHQMEFSPPRDLSHHFSRVTVRRNASSIKMFYKYWLMPGMGNLAGGLPNENYFPYDTLEASVATPVRFKPTPNRPVQPPSTHSRAESGEPKSARVIVPHDSTEPDRARKIDLATALQYGRAEGYPPLHGFLKEFTTTKLHPEVPYAGGPDIILTAGSTDGFSKVIEAFSNTWDDRRDPLSIREGLICEDFAYGQPMQAARPRGLNILTVMTDEEGMRAEGPGGLADVLARWDTRKGRIPHLMYTVTMGQNPTSSLLSVARRKKIYAICQRYDIIIVEDDPYWYLQYPSANQLSFAARGEPVSYAVSTEQKIGLGKRKSSGSPFLDSLVPSYLSIDVDGRVVRLDTFSKTIAPGCRLGWITAQPVFIERMLRITECFAQQPSGFVQSLVSELILGAADKHAGDEASAGWQMDGWIRWLEGLRGNYERRMQVMTRVLEENKYVIEYDRRRASISSLASDDYQVLRKTQIYDFAYPMAGMFLWVRCNLEIHPLFGQYDNSRFALAMWVFLTRYHIMVAPGTMFASSDAIRQERGWQYLRICFAAVDDDVVEELSKKFTEAMQGFWQVEDPAVIDDLLREFDEESLPTTSEEMAFAIPGAC